MNEEIDGGLHIEKDFRFHEPFTRVAQTDGFELMRIQIQRDNTVWVAPSDNPKLVELYCVLSGRIEVWSGEKRETLEAGDCFYTRGLKRDARVNALCDAKLLYVANGSVFDAVSQYRELMNDMIRPIDAKDHITLEHSRHVMRYAVKLYDRLGVTEVGMDDMVAAALFHDAGKCKTPDEILKKAGKLTSEEYEVMKRHASDGCDVLLPIYGEQVARIARSHHERLDGSGYPDGLSGGQIGEAARIVAVADSFEAMTHRRSYNRVKTARQAVDELRVLSRQYDARAVEALASLVEDGQIRIETETQDDDFFTW